MDPCDPPALGWTPALAQELARLRLETERPDLIAARVAVEHRGTYDLLTPAGPVTGRVTGRLRHAAVDARDLPAVGDWVALDPAPPHAIRHVLARRTLLVRQAAGRRTEPQPLAANVDTVFIVTAFGEDFSGGRLSRYRRAVADGGAEPVVVLNKVDLCPSPERLAATLDAVPRGLTVVPVCATAGDGVGELAPWLLPGYTVALIGSSGVGKSTLLNRLLGQERQATREVRDSDATGRHTTTRRELIPLPGGGVLIDTPGLREMALWASEDAPEAGGGSAVDELAAACRFPDCTHDGEPGCAVEEALRDGRLAAWELASHRKLAREQAHQERRQDAFLARDHGRQRQKMIRTITKAKKRGV
jgi:ribosome biogenesis GTPase